MLTKTVAMLAGGALALIIGQSVLAGPPPPTPTQPAAPSNVQISPDFSLLTWDDNANNEDGFRVRATLNGDIFEYTLPGANQTSFAVPQESVPQCPQHSSATYEVFAYNVGHMSMAGTLGIAVDCPPAAPSDLTMFGGVLRWADNSDNEDGFRIYVELQGDLSDDVTQLTYEVGTDVTSFALPPEAMIHCPDVTSISARVGAFNAFGESSTTGVGVAVLCPAPLMPTPTATVAVSALPQTGGADGARGSSAVAAGVLAFGALLLGSVAWRLRRAA